MVFVIFGRTKPLITGRASFDTNALLINPHYLNEVEEPMVCYIVLQELDKLKMEKDSERGWQARRAVRALKENQRVLFVDTPNKNILFGHQNNDDIIINCSDYYGAKHIVSGDFLVQLKSKAKNINVIDIFDTLMDKEEYKGYTEKVLDDDGLAELYENLDKNIYGLHMNEYLIVKNERGDILQAFRWNGEAYLDTQKSRRGFKTVQFGKFEPRDVYQQFVIDSFEHNQITMVKGKPGSGKSLLSLNYAINQLEKKKYEKLICFVNPMASRGSARLGFYPGDRNEKLLDSAVGSMLGAKFGDKIAVEQMIASGKLVLLPFSDIRGFDTSGQNAIVYVVEAQNLNIDLMKLALQRVGEDSKLIIDGDYQNQVDSALYEGSQNGMRRVSQVFRGQEIYGEIELPIIYRSRIADIADLM